MYYIEKRNGEGADSGSGKWQGQRPAHMDLEEVTTDEMPVY